MILVGKIKDICQFFSPAYIAVVEKEVLTFESEARQFTKVGDVPKAELLINKSRLAKKEVNFIISSSISVSFVI